MRFLTIFVVAALLYSNYSFRSSEVNRPQLTVNAVKLYDSLKNPWGMVWLPDGRLLVTERAGDVLVFKNNKFTGEKLSGLPTVKNKGQGGLMDIVLHPDFKSNGWIYISYSKPVND